jgi:hypothetical protein
MTRNDTPRRSWPTRAVIGLLVLVTVALLARCDPPIRLLVVPPAPTILSAPPRLTHRTTAAFRYSDAEPHVSFRCALDHVRLRRCPSEGATYTRLRTGVHVFKIAAQKGRLLSEAAWWRWEITPRAAARDGHPQGRPTPATTSPGAPPDSHDVIDTFTITGVVEGLLAPGRTRPVNVVISNPFDFDIKIVSVTISVRDVTMRDGRVNPGCVGTTNLGIVQTLGATPLIPSHETRSLEQLDVPRSQWPKVSMPDLLVNQDACKNTTFSLRYTGRATKS